MVQAKAVVEVNAVIPATAVTANVAVTYVAMEHAVVPDKSVVEVNAVIPTTAVTTFVAVTYVAMAFAVVPEKSVVVVSVVIPTSAVTTSASKAAVGLGSTLWKVVSVTAGHLNVQVRSRRHGCGTVRNTTVAVLPVPNVCKPEHLSVIQAEQNIASVNVWHLVRSVHLVTSGSTHQRLPEFCVGAAIDENQV